MKVIDNKTLKKLRINKKVDSAQASKILAIEKPVEKPPVPVEPKPDHIDLLVVTVAEAIRTTTELNQRATDLLSQMFIRVSAQPEIAPPVVNMTMPEPAKKLRFTVTKRDRQGLLEEVEAERLE